MIMITVTGDTYYMRYTLDKTGFEWKPEPKEWVQIVSEASLDKNLDAIMPDIAKIYIRIQTVDVHGNPLSPDIMKFCLTDVERLGVSVLESFNNKISDSLCSPIQSPGPINLDRTEENRS